ncbi:glycosyltransferase family A protein [Bacillus sp. CGMCC 1.16541]|uniref:glycosyltransferase family 2 protein n=1 Tax=Bacillus sp. CGMCC 1.16541 TaxID=2185143 RepID=UPI0013A57900|nr:glycosyltransferase family A protein [Bacillus sp. CGMCC 1.16541]
MKKFRYSLILCTVNRTDFLESFLECLCKQEYKDFELILVDQNLDDRVNKIVDSFKEYYKIKHIKSEKGLSKARNIGLKHVEGDIIAFPDDDCIYSENMLEKINDFFNNYNYEILSIKMTNNVPGGRKVQHNVPSQEVNRKNVMKLMASISMFYKRNVINKVGGFDERLGLGAKTIFQGGEDYDYPLRAMNKGFKIYYDNTIEVFHPWDDKDIDQKKNLSEKSYNGGAAEMFLLNKHHYNFIFKLMRITRRIIIILYYIMRLDIYRAKLSFSILKGMLSHFFYKVELEKK